MKANKIVNRIPPIVPSHVFLGEIRSNNFVLPKNFPDKKANVSLVQIKINIPANKGKVLFNRVLSAVFIQRANKNGTHTYIKP